MNQKISAKAIQRGLWMGVLFAGAVAASADTIVSFQVDMSAQIGNSTFNPPPGGSDTVWAQGTFNGWGHLVLTNNPSGANPNLYGGAVDDTTDANGTVMSYKFGDSQQNYENPAAEGNGSWNRVVTLPTNSGASLSLPDTYFDDAGPGTAYAVTFQVDMAQFLQLGKFSVSDGVYCQGWFEGWNDNFQMTNNQALNVTNEQGTITSLPYQGTYTTWSVSPGEQSDYKFVYTTGANNNYENVSTANANPPSGNRFFFNEAQVLPLVNFNDEPFVPPVSNNITFEVDMTAQILSGAFTTNESVTLNGDFNNWSGQLMSNNPDSSTPDIYSTVVTILDAPGAAHQYKYVENGNYEGVPNRVVDLLTTNGSFTNGPVYFNNQPPVGADFVTVSNCMVTFTVNMTNAVGVGTDAVTFDNAYPSGDEVYINGINNGENNDFWTWGQPPYPTVPGAYQMTQISNTMLFTITLPVNQGQNAYLEYKYSLNGYDNEAGFNDNHYRWIRSQPNYTMPVDSFGAQGSGSQTEISFGDLAITNAGGNQVQLSWLGRGGVELQTTPSLSPATWTSQPLTDGTNLLVAPGGMATTNLNVAPGSLFYRLVGPQ